MPAAKFILIDHSLKGAGGHHFEYAAQLLRAALAAGFATTLAAHRKFRGADGLPTECRVVSLFQHDTYSRHCLYFSKRYRMSAGTKEPATAAIPLHSSRRPTFWRRWVERLRNVVSNRQRRRHIAGFAAACRRLFAQIELAEGDQVFVPTISELDLAGLVQFLRATPETRLADWHLQFHFDVFDGRPPEYESQTQRGELLRDEIRCSLAQVPAHRLHCYNTTEPLTLQYNRLSVAPFQTLPYPVRPAFRPTDRYGETTRPVRITLAGYFRREKGRQHLTQLIRELWPEFLSTGQAQLVIQCRRSQLNRLLPHDIRPSASQVGALWSDTQAPIVLAPHPLDTRQYIDFVCDADIGLFLYDSRRYYARCSGVLVEMLSAGVPVVVPAGCWLADQIEPSNQRYLDRLAQTLPPVGDRVNLGHVQQNVAETVASREVLRPAGATEAVIGFRRQQPQIDGMYVRVAVTQFDNAGRELQRAADIVGGSCDQPSAALIHLSAGAARLRIDWSSAYDQSRLALADVAVSFFASSPNVATRCPAGSVGLTIADQREITRLLRDLVGNHAHYRRCAREFSAEWRADHSPSRIVRQLLRNADDRRHAA